MTSLIPVTFDHEPVLPAKNGPRAAATGAGRTHQRSIRFFESIPGFMSEPVTVASQNHRTSLIRDKLAQVAGDAADTAVEVAKGKPGIENVTFAVANGIDPIISVSQKPGVSDYFLGSTAARVARRAPCIDFTHR